MKRTIITTGTLLASSLIIAMAFSSTAMAQAKSTSSTPQVDVEDAVPNAISYGSTRSNVEMAGIAAPAGETSDVGDIIDRANINTSRSNRKTNAPISRPAGCVTVDSAKDMNCNGVDDVKETAAVDSNSVDQDLSEGEALQRIRDGKVHLTFEAGRGRK